MKYLKPRKVTNGDTAGNDVLYITRISGKSESSEVVVDSRLIFVSRFVATQGLVR
jgi:hypothetical protein